MTTQAPSLLIVLQVPIVNLLLSRSSNRSTTTSRTRIAIVLCLYIYISTTYTCHSLSVPKSSNNNNNVFPSSLAVPSPSLSSSPLASPLVSPLANIKKKHLQQILTSPITESDNDATSIPLYDLLQLIDDQLTPELQSLSQSQPRPQSNDSVNNSINDNINNKVDTQLFYSSDFTPRQQLPIEYYMEGTQCRHKDCLDLFDGYTTETLRCELLTLNNSASDNKINLINQSSTVSISINIRWKATWIPPGSTWLYDLSKSIGWDINKCTPDPFRIATFSYNAVYIMFQNAFQTGIINLPISSVEGNTMLSITCQSSITNDDDGDSSSESKTSTAKTRKRIISIKESIDLVTDGADKGRLQNRRVAQELASWLDVSRRLVLDQDNIDMDTDTDNVDLNMMNNCISPEKWSSILRSRILSGVPGVGPLDIDPNASTNDDDNNDNSQVIIQQIIGGLFVIGFGWVFNFILANQIIGGTTGTVSSLCDDAPILEFGSGYLSECFGPYGDGPYVR
jgi:hypothetical protein